MAVVDITEVLEKVEVYTVSSAVQFAEVRETDYVPANSVI